MLRFVPLLVLALGCSPAARLRAHTERDTRTLGEAAGGYWLAVRWGDAGSASAWLETPEQKLQLARVLSEPRVRLTDAAVVQVVVGEELPEARSPETREGTALVRVEAYDALSGRASVLTVEQHWVRTGRTWVVDAERSPLGTDRPW